MLRVAVLDHERLFVDCLVNRLNAEEEFTVVGTAAECDAGLALAEEMAPDIILLTTELPGRGAFALAAEVIGSMPNTRLAFLTNCLSDIFLEEAMQLGAAGYLLKCDPYETLLLHLRRMVDGEQRFSAMARERLRFDERKRKLQTRSTSCLSGLSYQQLEVLRHLARGDSVKQVAHKVQQSERSVESQKYRIMQQLGIHDRVELTRFAIREGLTVP